MNLYRDAHGVIVGTQAEAKRMGKGWVPIEVPTDKQGLIAYLNSLVLADTDDYPPAPEGLPIADWCKLNEGVPLSHRHATQAEVDAMFTPPPAKVPGNGPTVDDMVETIMELDGFKLGNVAVAVTERISQLTKLLG